MYLIFLDIDGVLNHGYDPSRVAVHPVTGWGGQHPPDYNEGFNYHVESCVIALNALTRATEAKIVISSAWRFEHSLDELREILRGWGVVGDVVDVTPLIDDAAGFPAARIADIRAFLDMCPDPIEAFVVLDDQDIRLDINNEVVEDEAIEKQFVRTVTEVGLTPELAQHAARLLMLSRVGVV